MCLHHVSRGVCGLSEGVGVFGTMVEVGHVGRCGCGCVCVYGGGGSSEFLECESLKLHVVAASGASA